MLLQPKCSKRKCIHYIGIINDGDETTERSSCKAFRSGIPVSIAYGTNKHLTPIKGQGNDIIFNLDEVNK